MWCGYSLPVVDQVKVDRLTAEIAAIQALILSIAAAPTTVEKTVISYTIHGRQVTLKSSADPGEAIPALNRSLRDLLVDLARTQAGGIKVFYGVPR